MGRKRKVGLLGKRIKRLRKEIAKGDKRKKRMKREMDKAQCKGDEARIMQSVIDCLDCDAKILNLEYVSVLHREVTL